MNWLTGSMDRNRRKVANFYARLASIPSLENLSENERLALVKDLEEVSFLQLRGSVLTQKLGNRKGWERKKQTYFRTMLAQGGYREILPEMHRWARDVIPGLLRGLSMPSLKLRPLDVTWQLNLKKRELTEEA